MNMNLQVESRIDIRTLALIATALAPKTRISSRAELVRVAMEELEGALIKSGFAPIESGSAAFEALANLGLLPREIKRGRQTLIDGLAVESKEELEAYSSVLKELLGNEGSSDKDQG
jgi:hypothetical protein